MASNKTIKKNPVTASKRKTVNKQMELFQDGGLKDEGGMIDEVSGNDVPSGSTREEVRDDIPAQLSEGEFVFPADVVRFIGLEKLMTIRQKAKIGLQRMESMGQMGNSEEATMSDDMPFNLDDIDMEDDTDYNRGGVVKAANGTFVQDTSPTQYKPLPEQKIPNPARQPITANPVKPVIKAGVQKFLNYNTANPYNPQVDNSQYAPLTYNQFLGDNALGAPKTELRKYVHPDGTIRYIPFNLATGEPLYPIDNLIRDGFVYEPEDKDKDKELTVDKVKPIEEPGGEGQADNDGSSGSGNSSGTTSDDEGPGGIGGPGGDNTGGVDTSHGGVDGPGSNSDGTGSSNGGGGGGGGGADGTGDGGSGGADGGDGGSGGGGATHICTATYNNGYINKEHFTTLRKYGILLRRNDPYMMKAYDMFGPKLASYVHKNKYMTSFAKFITQYYKDTMDNKQLSLKQNIFKFISKNILRPTYRIVGWTSVKLSK
jgi:hypothetical protein